MFAVQDSSWPNGIRNAAIQEVTGAEEDGNHKRYQDIAERIRAAVSERGLEKYGYHVLVASAWPGPQHPSWWPWSDKYASVSEFMFYFY